MKRGDLARKDADRSDSRSQRLSMKNFDFLLEHAQGEFSFDVGSARDIQIETCCLVSIDRQNLEMLKEILQPQWEPYLPHLLSYAVRRQR